MRPALYQTELSRRDDKGDMQGPATVIAYMPPSERTLLDWVVE